MDIIEADPLDYLHELAVKKITIQTPALVVGAIDWSAGDMIS